MVATSTVPAVRFVRVRHAGTESGSPARRRDARALRGAGRPVRGRDRAAPVASGDGQPGRVVERGSARARARPWRTERRRSRAAPGLAARRPTIAIADVRRCYASISPSIVGAGSVDLGIASAGEVGAFLARLERTGGEGLPVGPEASAVLANAVLAHVDERCARRRRASALGRRRRPVRRRRPAALSAFADRPRGARAPAERGQDQDPARRPRAGRPPPSPASVTRRRRLHPGRPLGAKLARR